MRNNNQGEIRSNYVQDGKVGVTVKTIGSHISINNLPLDTLRGSKQRSNKE
ncbi:hypothetical protein LCGC14_0970140 [marine sediment metagenome]|uniref:Uncharacterized protein n=1 Tax=marine sediment metagenome TaxID=412755 RepID=A0A0F9QV17_9ZZZZ